MRQITNATEGQKCIFRGESVVSEYPCSSSIYRRLKKEQNTTQSIPKLIKKGQSELIEKIHKYKEEGSTDLERLMAYQHKGGNTNLIDFTGDKAIALFFACQSDADKDAQMIIKRKEDFDQLEVGVDELPDDKVVILEPPISLLRARDQSGVLLHAPAGFLPLETGEAILIRSEWKQEILEYLKNIHDMAYETIFDDMQDVIYKHNREGENHKATKEFPLAIGSYGFEIPDGNHEVPIKDMDSFASLSRSISSHEFEVFEESRNIPIMEPVARFSSVPRPMGPYEELLKDKTKKLITGFSQVLEYDAKGAETYYNRALVHQSKSDPDYDQAIFDYTRAIELNPNHAKAFSNRGNTYASKRTPDYARAISDYARAIELNPSDVLPYYNRGLTYLRKSPPDYEQAISDFTYAIGLNPDYVEAYFMRGLSYMNMKKPDRDYEQAVLDFTRVIELNPNHAQAYANRAIAHTRSQNPKMKKGILDAISAWKRYLKC